MDDGGVEVEEAEAELPVWAAGKREGEVNFWP